MARSKGQAMSSREFRDYIAKKHALPQKKKRKKVESNIQASSVKWFRCTYPKHQKLLFSIPNGAAFGGNEIQRIVQGKRMKAEGAVPGAADLFLAIPSGEFPGLFIEMKTPNKSKSKQKAPQKEFEKAVIEMGYGYAIARSSIEFEKIVTTYLEKGEY